MTSYSARLKLGTPAALDLNWNNPLDANRVILDALATTGPLYVSPHEIPSASLNIDIAPGTFTNQNGSLTTYAGASSVAVTASSTNRIWLTPAGVLTQSTSAFPATPYIPLAVVTTTGSVITSIVDSRVVFGVLGWADGTNLALGTSSGTKIGTSVSQLLGFWNATPVVQPSGANQASLTDSSGGTASFTLASVGATNTGDVSATINNDIASLARAIAAIRTALVAAGIMKGSA
jgi:hypothetical protein